MFLFCHGRKNTAKNTPPMTITTLSRTGAVLLYSYPAPRIESLIGNKKNIIRGATLIHKKICALSEILTYLRQLTYVSRHSILSLSLFAICILQDMPLTVPSVDHLYNLRSIRLPPARTLWACTIIFTSTSSVFR